MLVLGKGLGAVLGKRQTSQVSRFWRGTQAFDKISNSQADCCISQAK